MYAQNGIPQGAGAPERFYVTELAEGLAGAEGPAVKKALLARLDVLTQQLEVRLRCGVAPKDYRDAELLKIAFRAAHRLVEGHPVSKSKLV